MSEFDKLKDDAEQYAKDHPEQVEKGEKAAEEKLGLPGQGDGQDAQGQAQQNQGGGGQGGQDSSGQDSSGQGQ